MLFLLLLFLSIWIKYHYLLCISQQEDSVCKSPKENNPNNSDVVKIAIKSKKKVILRKKLFWTKDKKNKEGDKKYVDDKEKNPSRSLLKLVVLPPNRPVPKPPKKHKKDE